MSYSKKTNHVEEGISNFISQFRKQPTIVALASVYLRQIQDIENALSDLLTETNLNNAVGVHLDNIGALVGEPRSGRNDSQYRIAISARILLNISNGTIEDVIAIAAAAAGVPVTIEIIEHFPASFTARIVEPIDPAITDTDRVAEIIASGRPAGVGGHLDFFEGTGTPFQFDGPAGSGFDQGEYGGGSSA
jgi:hypothetical protein